MYKKVYYDMLQDFAVANGMDKHGPDFIEALKGMQVKMQAAEELYDIDDLIFDEQHQKDQANHYLSELHIQIASAEQEFNDFMEQRLDTGPKLKRQRGLGISVAAAPAAAAAGVMPSVSSAPASAPGGFSFAPRHRIQRQRTLDGAETLLAAAGRDEDEQESSEHDEPTQPY